VEAALIHESGAKGLFDAVIAVRCDEATQLRRLLARGGMSSEAGPGPPPRPDGRGEEGRPLGLRDR
jgi:hypothetical protein